MKQNEVKIIILAVLIALLSVIGIVMARYISQANSSKELEIAYYVIGNEVQNQTLKLESMVPRDEAYNYEIIVSNFQGGRVAETAIEYYMQIKTTTNLPLQFDLKLSGQDDTQIQTIETVQDEDGMYYIVMKTDLKEFGLTKEEHKYVLSITLPKEYKSNSEYSDIMELVEIMVDSKQKI